MKNNEKNLGPVLVSFVAIFAAIGMILEACAVLFGYDPVLRVFKMDSKIAAASVAALFILSAAAIGLSIFVSKLGKMNSEAPESFASGTVAAIGGFAMIVTSVFFMFFGGNMSGAQKMSSVILLALSVPSGLYFILGTSKRDIKTDILAFFPPIWYAICLIRMYFEAETAINDPIRILLQVSLVSIMLALMYELKLRVKGTGKLMFTVTASLSVILECASAVAVFLLYFTVKIGTAADLFLAISSLGIVMYLISKLSGYYKM